MENNKKISNLFLSVGAMKAGTTWLYTQLINHPDIYFTPEKEIHYFANRVGIENQLKYSNRILKLKSTIDYCSGKDPDFISQCINKLEWYSIYANKKTIDNEWYIKLFSLKKDEKYCADFSNLYCQMDSDGWDIVRDVSKKVKVIYTLRDPFSRVWSHYKFHMKFIGREDEVLSAGFSNFRNLLEKHHFWVNAQYSKNYTRLLENLDKNELMLLYFEDFRKNPGAMLKSVQKFLEIREIAPAKENLNKKVNVTKDFQMPDEWKVYVQDKLRNEIENMRKLGLWHESWQKI